MILEIIGPLLEEADFLAAILRTILYSSLLQPPFFYRDNVTSGHLFLMARVGSDQGASNLLRQRKIA
jgi:hypothetical protein